MSTEEIVKGLYKIKVPLPVPGLKYVFVYLSRDNDQNLLIDTGWNDDNSYNAIISGFREIGFDVGELQNILVSHLHPDHFGLAGRLKTLAPGAKVLMSRLDASQPINSPEALGAFAEQMQSFARMHGTPEEENRAMSEAAANMARRFLDAPAPDVLLNGDETIKVGNLFEFRVILAPGHTKGNLCLYETSGSNLLFSGDHILPTVTPNVSLSPLYLGDPLGDYLRSLEAMKKMNASRVLPSHEFVFENLTKRVDEIEVHHQERLDEVLRALEPGAMTTGYEVSTKIRWHSGSWNRLSSWEKRSALTETLAHLEYLKRRDRIFEFQEDGGGLEKKIFYSSKGS